MPEEIVMPRLSDTMEEGTIAQWLKHEGDTVRKGEPILEVETDKANMELQAYSDGVIQQILQGDGATVPIGAVIGILAKVGEAVAPAAPAPAAASTAAPPAAPATPATAPAAGGTTGAPSGAAADDANLPAPARAAASGAGRPALYQPAASAPSTQGNGASGASAGSAATAQGERVKASPLARKLAREYGIDLVALDGLGSGPGGRIVKLDVEQYAAQQGAAAPAPTVETLRVAPAPEPAQAPQAAPEPVAAPAGTGVSAAQATPPEGVELRPANRIQQVTARRLLESKTTVPHFYVTNEVDMAAAADLRAQLQATFGEEGRVSYNDLIVRACALALRAMPDVNASWRDGQFAYYSHVNVGIAVNLPQGLVVPVIKDADRKGLRELAAEGRALIEKARNGKLAPADLEGGTFTVSNLGMFDVEEFQAIINPPQSAILAVGTILDKPVALDGQVVVRPRMRLSLSVDHRVIPGVPAAQFLQLVKQLLQEPLRLGF